jgi:predicted molibdopterin-dependent oxidoreductase YjgC
VRQRTDHVLLREDRNPNTQGCLDLALGRAGIAAILEACRRGSLKALLLQGPELLRLPEAGDALARVPFIAVMASHEGPELDRAHCVLPAAAWAEVEGTFTNYERRVQRLRAAVPAPGEAQPRFELAAGLLQRLGQPVSAATSREIFVQLARAVPDYAGLDYRTLAFAGQALPLAGDGGTAEARA